VATAARLYPATVVPSRDVLLLYFLVRFLLCARSASSHSVCRSPPRSLALLAFSRVVRAFVYKNMSCWTKIFCILGNLSTRNNLLLDDFSHFRRKFYRKFSDTFKNKIWKNDFAKVSENLARFENNFVELSK